MTKRDIAAKFRELERLGFKVLNFGDNRQTRIASKDMTDSLVVGHGFVHFVEIKMIKTQDRFRDGQKIFGQKLKRAEKDNKKVFYHIVNENNHKKVIDNIILMQSGVR